MKFLEKLAKEIVSVSKGKPENICVILPGRRAGLFLNTYLAKAFGRTVFAPEVFTIEDFVMELSGYERIDNIALLFELYAVHCDIEGDTSQSFEDFLKWSRMMLSDFNEVDMYMISPDKLYSYLGEAKAAEKWCPGEELTAMQKDYIEFYRSMQHYYKALKERLQSKGLVYQGLAARHLAENIEEKAKSLKWEQMLFAGFNVLSPAEKQITDYFIKDKRAKIFWDADSYYMNDNMQEAGLFLRKYYEEKGSKSFQWNSGYFSRKKGEVSVRALSGNVAQAKHAAEIIKEIIENEADLSDTALVLADEALIIPVLSSIPPEAGPYNVTMGLPFKQTPIYTLIEKVLALQENAAKMSTIGKKGHFYFRNVLSLLRHPYVQALDEQGRIPSLIKEVEKANMVMFNYDELIGRPGISLDNELGGFLKIVLRVWESGVHDSVSRLESIVVLIRDKLLGSQEGSRMPDIEFLYHFSAILYRLRLLLNDYPYITEPGSLRTLLRQLMQTMSIPFYGEPMRGLQVMGVLETRALDFKNLIMLSVNEGVLPAGRKHNSFIPMDIKREYGLPTHHEKNAIFANHFYRLLQRAENIYLLYNSKPGALGGGEKSRYILQLQHEMPLYNPHLKIKEQSIEYPLNLKGKEKELSIDKDDELLERLRIIFKKGLSPSALSMWISCPMKFYFHYLSRLREASEVEESPEASTLGSVVHKVLEELYKPYLGTSVKAQNISNLRKFVPAYTEKAFKQKYHGDTSYGKNLLIFQVAQKMVFNFLSSEEASLKKKISCLEILGLEKNFEAVLNLNIDGVSWDVKLKGTIDRIEKIDNNIRVVDYKTGLVPQRDLKLDHLENIKERKLGKALQLIIYSYLYRFSSGSFVFPDAGIISLRTPSAGLIPLLIKDQEFHSNPEKHIKEYLHSLVKEIIDPEFPFQCTDDERQCSYCPFSGICMKY